MTGAKKRVLVTSALESTWPDKGQPVLFLGSWCQVHERRAHWQKLDFSVVPYHWEDRAQVYRDHLYLAAFIDRLLEALSQTLNQLHQVNYSIRFWRIVLGPWLINFVPVVFDRYQCVEKALSSGEVSSAVALKENDEQHIPMDMKQFSFFQEQDLWNEFLIRRILQLIGFDRFDWIEAQREEKVLTSVSLSFGLKEKVKNTLIKVSRWLTPSKGYFIMGSYLNTLDYVKLQLRLLQLPLFYRGAPCSQCAVEKRFRQWRLEERSSDNVFERTVKSLLVEQMPKAYLEGFKSLLALSEQMGWPRQPKLIWTSNAHYGDDVFKLWAARKVDVGVPLIIGQHGGHYGQGLYSMPEDHELKICDAYLSWGWRNHFKVNPVGILKKVVKQDRRVKKHGAVFVLTTAPRYGGTTMSFPIGPQVGEYLNVQVEFYAALEKTVAAGVNIRCYPHDYGWDQAGRFLSRFPEAMIDDGKRNFNELIAEANLVVVGWNATTYLESMASGVPTVIFWDSRYFEINEQAKDVFEQLKRVGIFHVTPVSAAKHVNTIWHNVDKWWQSVEVRKAREVFLNLYAANVDLAKTIANLLGVLVNAKNK